MHKEKLKFNTVNKDNTFTATLTNDKGEKKEVNGKFDENGRFSFADAKDHVDFNKINNKSDTLHNPGEELDLTNKYMDGSTHKEKLKVNSINKDNTFTATLTNDKGEKKEVNGKFGKDGDFTFSDIKNHVDFNQEDNGPIKEIKSKPGDVRELINTEESGKPKKENLTFEKIDYKNRTFTAIKVDDQGKKEEVEGSFLHNGDNIKFHYKAPEPVYQPIHEKDKNKEK